MDVLRAWLAKRGIPKKDWRNLKLHGVSREELRKHLSAAAPDLFSKLTDGGFRTAFLQKQTLVRIAAGDE
jgi:hypothetical protein